MSLNRLRLEFFRGLSFVRYWFQYSENWKISRLTKVTVCTIGSIVVRPLRSGDHHKEICSRFKS